MCALLILAAYSMLAGYLAQARSRAERHFARATRGHSCFLPTNNRRNRWALPLERLGRQRLPRGAVEQQVAVRHHRGLAAGGVVGEDRHDVAADLLQRIAVIEPAG